MTDTPAAQKLGDLEARILDGENIDAAELAAARAAVDLEELQEAGRRRRAEIAATEAARQAVEKAKADAVELRRNSTHLAAAVEAFDQAKGAIERMAGHLADHNQAREDVIRSMLAAQVPHRSPHRRGLAEGVDPNTHLVVSPGRPHDTGVVVDGSGWSAEDTTRWLSALLAQARCGWVKGQEYPHRGLWPDAVRDVNPEVAA